MKMHVLFNRQGDIVAAAQSQADGSANAVPMADEQAGHRVAEMEVPTEYRQEKLAAMCKKLRVDAAASPPRLMAKK